MRLSLAAAALFIPITAQAETIAKSISYFMAHPAELRQTMTVCHDNSQYANTPTCINVEAASIGLRARQQPDFSALFTDPRYWSANPVARDNEIARCANGTSMLPQYCRYAAQSALDDTRNK